MGADWQGLRWHSRDCPRALPSADRVAATSSAVGRHPGSPAFSAVPSVLCLGLENDMQALLLLKNFTAPEVFIEADISKGKQVRGAMAKDRMPPFSSVPRRARILVVSAFPISSTKDTIVQDLESKSRSNLNPLRTESFLIGQVLLNLVSCDLGQAWAGECSPKLLSLTCQSWKSVLNSHFYRNCCNSSLVIPVI